MRPRRREITIFSLSMLDVLSGALGAFVIVTTILLPYYDRDPADYAREESELRTALAAAADSLRAAEAAAAPLAALREELRAAEDSLRRTRAVEADAAQLPAELAAAAALAEARAASRAAEERLGFTFRNRDIVFVVDVSGSMGPPTAQYPEFENSIRSVVAGIKMLVATMDESYRVDVVFFPNEPDSADYGVMWGELRPVTEARKYEVYRFLAGLEPRGGTPTGDVLDFVISGGRYRDARTLVLLTDGAPTEGTRFLGAAELDGIITEVTARNGGRLVINTIGVGKPFRQRGATSDAIRFLQRLAERNGGFYVGF